MDFWYFFPMQSSHFTLVFICNLKTVILSSIFWNLPFKTEIYTRFLQDLNLCLFFNLHPSYFLLLFFFFYSPFLVVYFFLCHIDLGKCLILQHCSKTISSTVGFSKVRLQNPITSRNTPPSLYHQQTVQGDSIHTGISHKIFNLPIPINISSTEAFFL